MRKALPHLGGGDFFVMNADAIWVDGPRPSLLRLAEHWDPSRMDVLLLLAHSASATGWGNRGDFAMDKNGALRRPAAARVTPSSTRGAGIWKTSLFAGRPEKFSLNRIFDEAIAEERLHGLRLDGLWMHVGTPDAIPEAEAAMLRWTGEGGRNAGRHHPSGRSLPGALVESCLDGSLGVGFAVASRDFSQATIYVPTRRAARALAHAFAARLQPGAVLLPRIVPLGDPATSRRRPPCFPKRRPRRSSCPPSIRSGAGWSSPGSSRRGGAPKASARWRPPATASASARVSPIASPWRAIWRA